MRKKNKHKTDRYRGVGNSATLAAAVASRINEARVNGGKLNLAAMGLRTVPKILSSLKGITHLDLSHNELLDLGSLGESGGDLFNLDVSGNLLSDLPSGLSNCRNLTLLDVSNNRFEILPDMPRLCSGVRFLNASANNISRLHPALVSWPNIIDLELAGNQLEDLIEGAVWPVLKSINLSDNNLTSVPQVLLRTQDIVGIDLSENSIGELPAEFFSLKKLERLVLHKAGIVGSLDGLSKLPDLVHLDVSSNNVALSGGVFQLRKLRHLNVSHVNAFQLSEELANLSELRVFIISRVSVGRLPNSIGGLAHLRLLSAWSCDLTEVPDSLYELRQLKYLDVSDNQLYEMSGSIGNCQNLEQVDFSNNKLKRLPVQLRELRKLDKLFVYGNPDLGLPAEIAGGRPDYLYVLNAKEILAYYFANQASGTPINELKLVVVGRGAAGKTSLIKRMVSGQYDPNECETAGIEVKTWSIQCNDGERVRLHTWDFGGQEILHATHQFFFSERCIYLLVLTGREDRQQLDAEYWLQLIGSFGGDSRVLIVLNKSELHPFDLNRQSLLEKYGNRIVDFFKVDCATSVGIVELMTAISVEVGRSEHRKVLFPTTWFSIKEYLSGSQDDYMSWSSFEMLCTNMGETEPSKQELLANYLHELGIALHYSRDPRLSDTHVLNPRWVTEGVYSLLRSGQAQGKFTFSTSDLSKILDLGRYPRTKHDFLLRLMELYQLCFKLPNDAHTYLIPELLPRNQPDTKEFVANADLSFCYVYSVLPEGLLPRFIVQTHEMSERLERWRSGTWLRWGECSALVIADQVDGIISVHISGPLTHRRELLAVIRQKFDEQNRSLKGIRIAEKIPLKIAGGGMVDYRDLLKREQRGEIEFYPENMDAPVRVRELLDGVESLAMRENRIARNASPKEKDVRLIINTFGDTQINTLSEGTMNSGDGKNIQVINGGSFSNSALAASMEQFSWNVAIAGASDSKLKEELNELSRLVEKIIVASPAEVASKARKNMEVLTKEALGPNPDKEYLKLSAKGLTDAAQAVVGMAGPVVAVVEKIVGMLA